MAVDTDLEDVNQVSPAQISIMSVDFGFQTTVYIPFDNSGSINILFIRNIQLKYMAQTMRTPMEYHHPCSPSEIFTKDVSFAFKRVRQPGANV